MTGAFAGRILNIHPALLPDFGGHGMHPTASGGRVVAEGSLGQSERYRSFAPFGLEWTGGLAGMAAVQLTYWQYQAMDAWRERKG